MAGSVHFSSQRVRTHWERGRLARVESEARERRPSLEPSATRERLTALSVRAGRPRSQ